MFRNTMPRYEILSEDAMAALDRGWRRIVSELGIEFILPEAVEYFREAGQKVEDSVVKLDPEFVLEQVAKAPREFDVQARNPEHSIHIGGDAMAFGAVYGPPFLREGDVRRDATMDDFRNFAKLSQSYAVMDSAGGVVCEVGAPSSHAAIVSREIGVPCVVSVAGSRFELIRISTEST